MQSACRGEIKFGNGLHPYAVPMLTSLVEKASLLRILESPFVELRSKGPSASPRGASYSDAQGLRRLVRGGASGVKPSSPWASKKPPARAGGVATEWVSLSAPGAGCRGRGCADAAGSALSPQAGHRWGGRREPLGPAPRAGPCRRRKPPLAHVNGPGRAHRPSSGTSRQPSGYYRR